MGNEVRRDILWAIGLIEDFYLEMVLVLDEDKLRQLGRGWVINQMLPLNVLGRRCIRYMGNSVHILIRARGVAAALFCSDVSDVKLLDIVLWKVQAARM